MRRRFISGQFTSFPVDTGNNGRSHHRRFLQTSFMCLMSDIDRQSSRVEKLPSLFGLSPCKLLVYSDTTDAVSPDLRSKKGTAYCDLTLQLCRCQGEMWVKKIKKRGYFSMPRGTFILEKGKCTCLNIYVATGPLLPKAIRLHGFSHSWSCLCMISDIFFIS